MIVECAINAAKIEKHIDIVKEWFTSGKISDLTGRVLENVDVSNKHKHLMIRRIYSSFTIPLEEKERLLE